MSQSATLSPSREIRADKLQSRRFDIGMRDFVGDAAFLQENRPSLSLKRKRASADLPTPSSCFSGTLPRAYAARLTNTRMGK